MSGERYVVPPEMRLGPNLTALALLLATREKLHCEVAFEALYGDRDRPPARSIVRVHVCHLGQKFVRFNLKIETVWGWGWQMPADDRERLRAMIRPSAEVS